MHGKLSQTSHYAVVAIVLIFGSSAFAQTGVTIVTGNGRLFTGDIDERSDDQTLWIRLTEENIVLTSAVAWSDIVSAELEGKPIEVAELLPMRDKLASSGPRTFLTEFEPLRHEVMPTVGLPIPLRSPVVSIEIDAGIANLDRTVEADGLVLVVSALDAVGNSVPVRGSLSARLIVERLNQHTGEVTFEEFGRWSRAVSPSDFFQGVAEVPLRFRRLSPEFDWELCTAALLNVRLSVHGDGNFEDSIPIAIHEFNPIRDEIRNQQGSRFFRDELSHRTRHDGTRNLHRGYSSP